MDIYLFVYLAAILPLWYFVMFPVTMKLAEKGFDSEMDRVDVYFGMVVSLLVAFTWPILIPGYLLITKAHAFFCKKAGL